MTSRPAHPGPSPVTGWVAAGAGLIGVLLGGVAVAFGVRERPTPPPAIAAAPEPEAAATEPVALASHLADATTPAGATDELADAVARTRDAVVSLGTAQTLGAGVIVDASGVVLTNYHVIASALRAPTDAGALEGGSQRPTVMARFENGREIAALVLVADAEEDLAILRLLPEREDERFSSVSLGKSADLRVGQEVFSIGNPFGLSHTVSRGIVSALDRTGVLENRELPLVQLDAAINVGNSGGPLFALDGRLMGIVTARRQQAHGIAFAVPVDHVRGFLRAVQDPTSPRSGAMGIEMRAPETLPEAVRELGYAAGLAILAVEEDGPAARAGLRVDDTIVALRGKRLDGLPKSGDPVALAGQVVATVRSMFAGEHLPITVVREGELVDVSVEIAPATVKRQALIDAEELLGLRLAADQAAPTVEVVLPGSPLVDLKSELVGAKIERLVGENVETLEQLGEVLAEVRTIVRQHRRAVAVLIGFRNAQGEPAEELHVLVR